MSTAAAAADQPTPRAHVVALSGGKDSTALALRLRELHPDQQYTYLCTPTGDELPPMLKHWFDLERRLGQPLKRITNGTLASWSEHWQALPNLRQRWCTRVLKIRPCLDYLATLERPVLYVGLRADEEARRGIYSADIECRFPLREWGWGLAEVQRYLREGGVRIPRRTDCARCPAQRLNEWWDLWRDEPAIYADAVRREAETGHTYRNPRRDAWPTDLAGLRAAFVAGRVPRGASLQVGLFDDDDDAGSCRVCRL